MKTGNSLTTRSHYIQKGVAAPGLGVAVFFRPRAQSSPGGPGPPCCIGVGSGDAVPAGFPEKKTGRPSGVLMGAPPKRLFAPFGTAGSERVLHAEKGCGRAFDILFSGMPHGMRGQTEKPFYTGLA